MILYEALISALNSRVLPSLSQEYRVMRLKAQKPRPDIYETITSKLLAAIEAAPATPSCPGCAAARGRYCRAMPSPAKPIAASTS